MTDEERFEKVVKGLECCMSEKICDSPCPYKGECDEGGYYYSKAIEDAIALLKALSAFKSYFDSLYGQGLEVANWHLNGATESFDNFYDSAMEEYENARCD